MVSSQNQPGPPCPKALITGANGFVGSHLADRLAELGYDLSFLLRTTSNLDNIEHLQYRSLFGDLLTPASLEEAVADVDYIFHPAGLVKARSAEEFHRINAGGTENLLTALVRNNSNIKRFVFISSQAAAGPCRDRVPKTESDPATPVSDYGRSKLAAEKVVQRFSDKVPATIIRPPAIFGPRDTDVLQFFQAVRAGFLLKFGRRESFVSLAHVSDVVEGALLAATNESAVGETFFINSEDDLSQWQVQLMMAEVMKVDVKPLLLPLPILRMAGSVIAAVDRMLGHIPDFSRDKAIELSYRYWLSSSEKARDRLGLVPRASLAEHLKQTYEWYREHRWL